jgi:putative membrane-bound dehydrogenase-like protein
MKLRSIGLFVLGIVAAATVRAQEDEAPAPAGKPAPANKGRLVAAEFCPFGTIGSPVGISVDDQNRVFVTETARRTAGELDIRKHWDFLLPALASTSVEEKRAFIRANYKKGDAGDANRDGVEDWRDLTVPDEKIRMLIDTDGDGKADKVRIFAEKFNTEVTGVAGGVLAFGGHVYTTITPDLWKLTDTTGQGVADRRESLAYGFGVHIGYGGHDMHGPVMGPDSRIYWSNGDKGTNVVSKEGRRFYYPYQGAVYRCEPDGSNFEVFAHGLRNVQEIAFDDFGNLISVDNDADLGDRERFVYIVQNTDSGWRATYQYRGRKIPGASDGGYNPWMAEDLWKPRFDTQAAYLTPPLSNYSDGPCGFKYNPGTALSEEYRGSFFLTHFPKKLLTTFKAQPDGAGFKMVAEQVAFSGLMMTGIAFGADGAIYAADWGENGWVAHTKGRVVRIDVPGTAGQSALRVETQTLLEEGMAKRPAHELVALLGHADQRVRQRAQFELVTRGDLAPLLANARANDKLLTRVHAMWGLGQIARRKADTSAPALAALVELLKDTDPEVRAQAVKLLADAHYAPAGDAVAALLADDSPRVRMHAGVALERLARPEHLPAIVALAAGQKAKDVYIRHAAIVAMVGACAKDAAPLAALASHADRNVRLAAIVALRRLAGPLIERFLDDADPWVLAEAARAIHDDGSIPAALPALARLTDRPGLLNEPLLRRAINANLRVGDEAAARRLVAYATSTAPAALRADALIALAWFATPPKLDRVDGAYRELPARDERLAHAALDPAITKLLNDPAPAVKNATVQAIRQLRFDAARERLAKIALDAAQPANVRVPALLAIHALKAPQAREAVTVALKADDARLRAAALLVLAQLEPTAESTGAAIRTVLAGDNVVEQQAALAALGGLSGKDATALLATWIDRLLAGQVPPALQLDVMDAATESKDRALLAKLNQYRSGKPKNDALAAYVESLEGGDPAEGELIFKSGQCTQCHLVHGSGGAVGPDLSTIGARLDRRKLLQSIVDPAAEIAHGFQQVSVTTKDGDTITGTIQKEDATAMTLKADDGETITIKAADIESRTNPSSGMPPMGDVLNRREIRHVVEYLTTLK